MDRSSVQGLVRRIAAENLEEAKEVIYGLFGPESLEEREICEEIKRLWVRFVDIQKEKYATAWDQVGPGWKSMALERIVALLPDRTLRRAKDLLEKLLPDREQEEANISREIGALENKLREIRWRREER